MIAISIKGPHKRNITRGWYFETVVRKDDSVGWLVREKFDVRFT